MKRIILATVLTLLTAVTPRLARAEMLIEPLVGYTFGQGLNFEGGDDFSSGDGLSYGGRIGYQKMGFQVGLDYLRNNIDMTSSKFDENLTSDQWAIFAGFKLPVLFRLYAGYIFSAEADAEINNRNLELEDGTGAKFGLGCTILPFLDINLEYRKGSYDKSRLGGVSSNKNVDFEAMMIGISLPFTI